MFDNELKQIKATFGVVEAELATGIDEIKATLLTLAETATQPVVTEDAPLMEYEQLKTAPKGFPYEEYSLKEAEDLRKVKATMEKIEELSKKLEEAEATFTGMRVETENKISEKKKEMGYEGLKKDIGDNQTKLADEVQREFNAVSNSLGVSKKILLRMKETVYTVYDKITKKPAADKDKLEALNAAMTKLLAPELVEAVTKAANESVAQIEKADTQVKRRFVSWQGPKTLHKQVKEELPKHTSSSIKQADVLDSLKAWVSGLWDSIKEFFAPVEESVTDLQSALEQTEPILDEMDALLAEGATASKKTAVSLPPSDPSNMEVMAREAGFSPCGLNADWITQAWFIGPGVANDTDGGYYLIDNEDDSYSIVQRFYRDGDNDEIKTVEDFATEEDALDVAVELKKKVGASTKAGE